MYLFTIPFYIGGVNSMTTTKFWVIICSLHDDVQPSAHFSRTKSTCAVCAKHRPDVDSTYASASLAALATISMTVGTSLSYEELYEMVTMDTREILTGISRTFNPIESNGCCRQ